MYNSIQTFLYMLLYKLPRTHRAHTPCVRGQIKSYKEKPINQQIKSNHRSSATTTGKRLDVWTNIERAQTACMRTRARALFGRGSLDDVTLHAPRSAQDEIIRTCEARVPTAQTRRRRRSPPTIHPMAAGSRCWGCWSRTTAPLLAAAGTAAGASRR